MKKWLFITLFLAFLASSCLIRPEVMLLSQQAPLSQPQKYSFPIDVDIPLASSSKAKKRSLAETRGSSPLELMLPYITSVKEQVSRNTCASFVATAVLETELIRAGRAERNIDLSEEWIHYLYIAHHKRDTDGTTNVNVNWRLAQSYGVLLEEDMPYIGSKWENVFSHPLAIERCLTLSDKIDQRACLLGHQDPSLMTQSLVEVQKSNPKFAQLRQKAKKYYIENFRDLLHRNRISNGKLDIIKKVSEVRKIIHEGRTPVLSVNVYYGAFDHPNGLQYDIPITLERFIQGIITTPVSQTRDEIISPQHPAGHSFQIVGYDDHLEYTDKVVLINGEEKEIKLKGFYIIKNSWGTEGFGREFTYKGVSYPGFGIISYDYAHRLGTFYKLKLKGENPQAQNGIFF